MVSIEDISKELCGGTHLESTGSIGIFKIIQEGSVASGVRRIEATTGLSAYKIIKQDEDILEDAAFILKVNKERLAQELESKMSRIKSLEKQISTQKIDNFKASLDELIQNAEAIKDIKIITNVIENAQIDLLRKNVDLIKQKVNNTVIVLATKNQDKALLVMGITPDLCQKGLDASKLILNLGQILGGSGGGTKPENFTLAFEELKNIIRNLI
jgi:alanyl-tRNA synthetase